MKKVIFAATIIAATALTSCGGVDENVELEEQAKAALYEETLKTQNEIDSLNMEIEELNEVELELEELEYELDNI